MPELKTPPERDPAAYYPETGRWAVAARVGLLVCVAAIGYASLVPRRFMPRLLYSYHLEHFAAFYLATLVAAAAFPRDRLRRILIVGVALGFAFEAGQMLWGRGFTDTYENCLADAGGVFAAIAPIALDRFRRMFKPRPEAA